MKLIIRYTQIIRLVLFVFVIITIPKIYGQFTSIPDPEFEADLVGQGIDSDGIINGQVLTSDIENITTLTITNSVQDFTGIQDFTELEIFSIDSRFVEILNLNNNIELRELYLFATNSETFNLTSLDLSENINLEGFFGENMVSLDMLNVKNGNNQNLGVVLPCIVFEKNCELDGLECIEVDNATAATNGEGAYGDWIIDSNTFVFSEDCSTLGVAEQGFLTIALYPNPVKDQLFFKTSISLQTATVYSLNGKLVSKYNISNLNTINTANLTHGLYFVIVEDKEENKITKKFVKN